MRVQGEQRVLDATRIGNGPGDVPGVFLNGLQGAALVGTDGVFAAYVGGLVYRAVQLVEKPPSVAGACAFVVSVRLRTVGRNALEDFRWLVGACDHIKEDRVGRRRERMDQAESHPSEIARGHIPLFEDLEIVDAGMRAGVDAVQF